MTTLDHLSLFDTMDVATDLLSNSPNYNQTDDQLVFGNLQKQRLPGLDREQFQTPFAEWQEHYPAKCAQDRIRARDRIRRFAEEQAKKIRRDRRSNASAGLRATTRLMRSSSASTARMFSSRGWID